MLLALLNLSVAFHTRDYNIVLNYLKFNIGINPKALNNICQNSGCTDWDAMAKILFCRMYNRNHI